MDISDTLAPNSDQLDGIDLKASGPRTFTVERVTKGSAEQPVQVHLCEFPRPWRPGKNMRRVLGFCWGMDASQWAGRCVTLYYDPDVRFGSEKPGGTRISHLSHIDGPTEVMLLVSRGKSATYKVLPLVGQPSRDWRAEADALTDDVALRALWRDAPTEARDYIADRAQSLTAGPNVTRAVAQQPAIEPEGWEK